MDPIFASRKTLTRDVKLAGAGIFSGIGCGVWLRPAERPIGIVFRVPEGEIPVTPENARTGTRYSELEYGQARIAVVEHLLSAVSAFGITDLLVEATGNELPFFDGSAQEWAKAIQEAGLRNLDGEVEIVSPVKSVVVSEGNRLVLVQKSWKPEYIYLLDAPGIGQQVAMFGGTEEDYVEQIAPARSYITRVEFEEARTAGWFPKATPDSGILFDEGIPHTELRFPNEPARHKLLDLMGDFALSGKPVCALIIGVRSGHRLNHRAVREVVAQREANPPAR
ncbi:MAG: UDP-3-O-acyl-N-acetylglucosamine deacetylase [bacterium JZ-2024 1]